MTVRPTPNNERPLTPFSRVIGQSRFIVLLAVISVLLVAVALFLIGVVQAGTGIWAAVLAVSDGKFEATPLTIAFLEIVATMLKAVVFYIIGVGLYSLFIAPLNLTVSLGVETLSDLEDKIVSVVIVILAVTFLEHFVRWDKPLETLQFGVALAAVVLALVFFQRHSHEAKEAQQAKNPDTVARAKKEMFEEDTVEHEISEQEIEGKTQSRG
ncbi:YqhA family protein [Deinococcus arenicola]|uniref:YqhA family protein n=1 Tax=Deinococcus arenicola TaxID=2994950 RepID=A0ABU4DWJ7_9DEIO|nr:YqhA family protein [Deinococcus sp. ZS9-10]MDV6376312.1 YqhA family protein [Deinococcus sp. ZS9-10]